MQRGKEDLGVALQPMALATRKQQIRRRPARRLDGHPHGAAAADQLRAGPQSQPDAFRFEGKSA
ncbi:hypothetical protein FHX62_001505 [Cupriavidus alkaliphilus]|nr:hypothetical protein [Cupriavidus alkaliphilus]